MASIAHPLLFEMASGTNPDYWHCCTYLSTINIVNNFDMFNKYEWSRMREADLEYNFSWSSI